MLHVCIHTPCIYTHISATIFILVTNLDDHKSPTCRFVPHTALWKEVVCHRGVVYWVKVISFDLTVRMQVGVLNTALIS